MTETPVDPDFDEIDLVRELTKESFFFFCQEFWSTVVTETPVWNWHIPYLCSEIQLAVERVWRGEQKLYDLIINQPPGTTKSTVISVLLTPWIWTRFPEARSICGSHTYDLVMDLSRKSRDVIISPDRRDGGPSYAEVFPEIQLRDDQNTKEHFMNTTGGFRKSVTVGGKSPTGFHANYLIIDDPLDPQKAASEPEIKNANDWMNITLPSRKVSEKTSLTILVMQRLHQNDPTGNWMARGQGDYKRISLPADAHEFPVEPPELEANYVDGLFDPVRLTRPTLANKRATLGEWGYAGQYGQSPVPRSGGMFKTAKLDFVKEAPPMVALCRYWDKAGTHMGGCFTAGALMGYTINKWTKLQEWWILDMVLGQWASEEREAIILSTAQRDGRKPIIGVEQEGGSGGVESADATVKRLAGFRVRKDIPKGDKTLRADPFATQVNVGNVHVLIAPWNAALLNEMQFFPSSTYKDQIDALSGAFAMLNRNVIKVGALW